MNRALFEQINKYAEDREIDFTAAKVIGEQQGIVWSNENELVAFKQVVDRYLKTFDINELDNVDDFIRKMQ